MRKSLFVIAAATLLASAAIHAQDDTTSSFRYKWHDGQGLQHFSDSLSAEAMKYGYEVVNDQGLVVQRVARPLTAEERAAAKKQADALATQQRIARDRANAESQMLAAYPDEPSFLASQQQALETIDQQIHTTQINLRSQEKALTDLLGRAADIERSKETVPKYLADSIVKQRDVVTGQRDTLGRQRAERARAVQSQLKQLQRYRELRAARDAAQ